MNKQGNSKSILDIIIRDIEPFRGERVIGSIKPGINVLIGANGSGKTTCAALIRAATSTGKKIAEGFAVVAGATRGWVQYAGKRLTIDADGSISRKGDAPPAELIPPAFETLNDPGLVGSEPRRYARLRSLCDAFGVQPAMPVMRELLPSTDSEEWQLVEPAVREVLQGFERVPPKSVPDGALALKNALQEARRAREATLEDLVVNERVAASRAEEAQAALEQDAGDELAEIPAGDEGNALLNQANAELARARAELEAARRAESERKVWAEQIEEASGAEQDVATYGMQAQRTRTAMEAEQRQYEQALAETQRLEDLLREARSSASRHEMQIRALRTQEADLGAKVAQAKERASRAQALREKLAALATTSVMALDLDLTQAEAGVQRAERLLRYRRTADAIERQRQEAKAAEERRQQAADVVGTIDRVDKEVWARLGTMLETRLPADSARVRDGVVEAFHLGEWRDLDSKAFSEGQRWEKVLAWMIAGADEKELHVSVMEDNCPVDDDALRRLSPMAAAKNLAVLVEKEEAGRELEILHMGGA